MVSRLSEGIDVCIFPKIRLHISEGNKLVTENVIGEHALTLMSITLLLESTNNKLYILLQARTH